jgi:ABC-type tungstate transport system substrate-binding protein
MTISRRVSLLAFLLVARAGVLAAIIAGVGRRVKESGLGLIAGDAFSAPDEDVALKGK